jgi:lipoprotein-releasing system permease protein
VKEGRARRLGRALLATLGPLLALAAGFGLSTPRLFVLARDPALRAAGYAACGAAAVLSLLSLHVLVLSRRLARGTPGRARSIILGGAFALAFAALAAAGGLILRSAPLLPSGALVTLEELVLLSAGGARTALLSALGLAAGAIAIGSGAAVSTWFLIPRKLRSRLFWIGDLLLVAACSWLTMRFAFPPRGGDELGGSTARLVISLLVGVRLLARVLPPGLDLVERFDMRSLVAARHLRSKKSGFLAAIGFLSILAVSVSSCALTTTLSVMGGFRQDLKGKILGNNAHIVIDRNNARIKAGEDPSQRIRAVAGVRGVSPYLSGEVMISSSSNLTGAVLRGIDLAHIAEVSELPRNMKVGSLDYLAHPERLSRVPPGQLGLGAGLPKALRLDDEDDVKPAARNGLSAQLEKALREPLPPEPEPPATSSLPSIVVGQELARSLRLYLGDEVNIVTPLGALGPTGPMPKSRPFRVAGIFYSGMYEYDMKFAYVTLAAAQDFLGTGPELSGVEVTVREPDRAQEVAGQIASALDGVDARARQPLRVRAWQELNKNLFGALALEKLAMFIALGLNILVASFCILSTLSLMVQEKGREVAVLKAMGASDRAIVGIFVLEGALIGVFGSLIGLALGYAACFAAENFGVRLNPEVYYIDRLPVHMDSSEFLAVGLSAVLVCLLVTIYPAQLASRLRPVDALRFE